MGDCCVSEVYDSERHPGHYAITETRISEGGHLSAGTENEIVWKYNFCLQFLALLHVPIFGHCSVTFFCLCYDLNRKIL